VPNLTRGSAPPVNLEKFRDELHQFISNVLTGDFYEIEKIPEKLRKIQDIAISGNGEPTTADEFGQIIKIIEGVLADIGLLNEIKCVLITNGSLVNRDYVKEGLERLGAINGEVWFKIDSATPEGIEEINQVSGTELSAINRLNISANYCPTYIQTCVFSFDGKLPSNEEKTAYVNLLKEVKTRHIPIKGVLLYGVERPSLLPEAANKIKKLPENWLIDFAEEIKQTGFFVRISA
jgi:wyosine [tRNA(Phe)-imidazoG37] synthetase (radical SAM superfamily)